MTIAEKLRLEGKKEGRMEEKIEIAKNLLKMDMEIDQIVKATDIDEEKIKLLKEEIKH